MFKLSTLLFTLLIIVGCGGPTGRWVWVNPVRPSSDYYQDKAECQYEARRSMAGSITGLLDPLRIFTTSESDLVDACIEAKGWRTRWEENK